MTGARRRALALMLFVAPPSLAPSRLFGQFSVSGNAGAVHYEQAASENSAGLSPEFRLESRHVAFGLAGAVTGGSDGGRVASLGPSLWAATNPIFPHVQLAGQLAAQYTSPHGDSSSYAAMGLGEVAFAGAGRGLAFGLGGGFGKIEGQTGVSAFKARGRGWFDYGPLALTLSAEPTFIAGSWYADVSLGAWTEFGPIEGTASLQWRQAASSGAAAGGSLELAWHFTDRLAAQISGGRYLRDPFQGLPAGTFLTVGVKVLLWQPAGDDSEGGVGVSPLGDVDYGSVSGTAVTRHGGGNNLFHTRIVPAIKKGNSAGGRGHKI